MTADILTLIAHHATLASVPHPLPSPAVTELDVIRPLRRQAQRRFDTMGLPRTTSLAAVAA